MNNNEKFLRSKAGVAWMRMIAMQGHPDATIDFLKKMNAYEKEQVETMEL